jgi:hypothetical protein
MIWLRWLMGLAVAAMVLSVGAKHITRAGVDPDAAQSVVMAVNLAHHGTISLAEHPPYTASDYREPIPVAIMALEVEVIDELLGPVPMQDYLEGERLKYLKYQNLFWLIVVCAGIFACVYVATRTGTPSAATSSF